MSPAHQYTTKFCLLLLVVVAVWSVIAPHDLFTWFLETLPIIIILPLLSLTYNKFRLTNLLYILITIHGIVLLIGAHYTYAEVPLFDWLKEVFDFQRNHYDRLGHFFQGAVPAIFLRELLLRRTLLTSGKWLFAIVAFCCFGISGLYEIIEWWVSVITEDGATAFLGTQGDVWDTQKDILMAGIGAISSQLLLMRFHDRQLAKLSQ